MGGDGWMDIVILMKTKLLTLTSTDDFGFVNIKTSVFSNSNGLRFWFQHPQPASFRVALTLVVLTLCCPLKSVVFDNGSVLAKVLFFCFNEEL